MQPIHPVISPAITTCKGSRGGCSLEAIEEITAIHLAQQSVQPTSNDQVLAFDTTQITSPLNYSNPQVGDPCHPLAAGAHIPAIAQPIYGTDCYNGAITGDVAATLGTPGSHVNANGPTVMTAMQVRRLTPVECERLQGFPDNFTRIPWKKKPAEECPDGPRYKALGNSMAVPCMKWIGERIGRQAC
jgi:DNA (cytosine-5)-methyltransferase 1